MEPSFYKKESTTLKNQDLINYSEKNVELLITIDPSEAMGVQLLVDAWLRNWLQSSKVLIHI